MSRLNKELGIAQGVGLMSTSLLGAGVFVVPALAASLAGQWSLLAWLVLIVLVLPVAFTFAMLGRQYPHAGGASHIVGQAMGARFERLTAFLFLSSIPVAIPAGLVLATGFWQALFELSFWTALAIKTGTLAGILLLGLGGARSSGNVQMLIAVLIMVLVVLLWWGGDIHLQDARLPIEDIASISSVIPALAVMFWCFVGIEAFTHLGEEFKRPERDFPIALLLGVVIAGMVYWGCSVAVIKSNAYGSQGENTSSIPTLVAYLFGPGGKWLAAIIGYLTCVASINIYVQGFARLLWSMADEGSLNIGGLKKLSKLSDKKIPVVALLLVFGISLLCVTVTHCIGVSLENLICYANGNFIAVYLLSMLAGVKLLSGIQRCLAGMGVMLCLLILTALGLEAVYVLVMALLFLGFDRLKPKPLAIKAG